MFNATWTELLVIAVVALVVIGPKDLPRAMRAAGRWTGRVKRISSDFQRQLNEVVREAELDDVKNQIAELRKLDPASELKGSLKKLEVDLHRTSADEDAAGGIRTAPETVASIPSDAAAESTPTQVS